MVGIYAAAAAHICTPKPQSLLIIFYYRSLIFFFLFVRVLIVSANEIFHQRARLRVCVRVCGDVMPFSHPLCVPSLRPFGIALYKNP